MAHENNGRYKITVLQHADDSWSSMLTQVGIDAIPYYRPGFAGPSDAFNCAREAMIQHRSAARMRHELDALSSGRYMPTRIKARVSRLMAQLEDEMDYTNQDSDRYRQLSFRWAFLNDVDRVASNVRNTQADIRAFLKAGQR